MSDVEWDADEFVPPPFIAPPVTDKWDGEDEEEEVKESWEDDDDKKEETTQTTTTTTTAKKKKKKLADVLAEKEKKRLEEIERRQKEKEESRKNMTPEEVLQEKLRIQKIQEDSDLQIATDLMADKTDITSLDDFDLASEEGLEQFRLALVKKIRSKDKLERSVFYIGFIEDLCRDLCKSLDADSIKRVTTVLNALYNEKVKASKPVKGKKKGAGKAKLNPGQDAIADDIDGNYAYDYDDYDDFI